MERSKEIEKLLTKLRKLLEDANVDHFIVAVGTDNEETETFDIQSEGYFSREFITSFAHNLIADLVRGENEEYDSRNGEDEDKPVLN
jgi:hypothetical protein